MLVRGKALMGLGNQKTRAFHKTSHALGALLKVEIQNTAPGGMVLSGSKWTSNV